jgi:enterobactin synthetase component D
VVSKIMPTPLPNPALFPAFVSQHTIRFDESDPRGLGAQFPGVALPVGLAAWARKRQLEFAAGRYCAREALRLCSPESAEAAIPSGPFREPMWPSGIVGTITHIHQYASVAVARARDAQGLGLDAEYWMRDDRASELVDPVADRTEVLAVARSTGLSFAKALTLVFSAKESVFKCLFLQVRRYFDFRDACVRAADSSRGEFTVELLVTLTPSLCAGRLLDGRFEYDRQVVRTAMTALGS